LYFKTTHLIFTDFLERNINLTNTPKRIVSLVPSQTELLVDLGLRDSIVGVSKFCVHPKNLRKEKTIVGETKQVKTQKIKSLQPDIILCNKEENTKIMVEELETIAPVHVSDIKTLDDNHKLILDYGRMFNAEDKASQILAHLNEERLKFEKFIVTQKTLKVGYLIWRAPWMAVGGDTFIDHMLEINRFENVFKMQSRYPEIDIDKLPELDILLLSSEPYPFKEKHLDEIPLPNEKIKFVNGEYFSWYGSRLLKSFDYFKSLR
jgi:ABC-type Fe3+-hydroxamate transport system substrate-binding protein